jgi:hypothetical protein
VIWNKRRNKSQNQQQEKGRKEGRKEERKEGANFALSLADFGLEQSAGEFLVVFCAIMES